MVRRSELTMCFQWSGYFRIRILKMCLFLKRKKLGLEFILIHFFFPNLFIKLSFFLFPFLPPPSSPFPSFLSSFLLHLRCWELSAGDRWIYQAPILAAIGVSLKVYVATIDNKQTKSLQKLWVSLRVALQYSGI